MRDEETLKAKEGKRQKQARTGKHIHMFLAYCPSSSPLTFTLWTIDVEPLSQLQVHQMLQKFREEYNTKFSNQDQLIAKQQSTIAEQQKALAEQQKVLTVLSDKVTHVGFFHLFIILATPTDTSPNSKHIH